MDILLGVLVFLVFWLAMAVLTILVYNAFKFLHVNRMNSRSDDWSRDHPAKGYEIDQRQPNFD